MDEKRITQIKVCCLVVRDNKILLIKEWSDSKKGYLWNIIKGTFEGETDKNLVSCSKREITEETKINSSPTGFLGIVNKNGFSTRLYFGFLCEKFNIRKVGEKIPEKQIKGEDIKEIKWFDLVEIKEMKEDQFVNDVGYYFIQKWLKGKVYDMEMLKELDLS